MAVYKRITQSASNRSKHSMKRHFSVSDLTNDLNSDVMDRWRTLHNFINEHHHGDSVGVYGGVCGGGVGVGDGQVFSGNGDVVEMVSRRKILSRSRDDLMNLNDNSMAATADDEEDVWYNQDKLYRDHMQEVLEKWTQIDDEIWAKVICFERNRRVAKAYARAPVLTINGSDDGFDGYRIGMLGFDNPMRDSKTEEVKRHIGHGVKIKMDDAGNILVKRVSKANVYVKDIAGQSDNDNSISIDALRLQNRALEMDKPVKLFDMKKFQHNVSRELKRAYPDRRKLEFQCISAIAFVKNEQDLLECPCWVIVINIVAMDMLKSKLPPVQRKSTNGGRVPIDEDPYSVPGQPGSGSTSASSRDKRLDRPPKLPPRDTSMSKYQIPKPDYEEQQLQLQHQHADENKYRIPHLQSTSRKTGKTYPDDPYYCGMKAHTPNFASKGVKSSKNNGQQQMNIVGSTSPIINAESPYARTWLMGPYMQQSPNHIKQQQQQQQQQQQTIRTQPSMLISRPSVEPIYDIRIDSEWENFWDVEHR